MPLASFTKSFGLDPNDFKMGYFLHLFNTPANANYVASMPPWEMYTPETMSAAGTAEFERWYAAEGANETVWHAKGPYGLLHLRRQNPPRGMFDLSLRVPWLLSL